MKQHVVELRSDSLSAFSFQVEDQLPDFLCAWLSDWLKEYIEGGAQFRDGQTLQFGYWPLMCKVANNQLRLHGPDSESMPIRWQDDLSNALRSMMVYRYVPESYGFEMDVPRATETATVGRHFDKLPMIMNRLSRVDNGVDSGWFFGSLRDDVDNEDRTQLSVMSLHEATLRAPWIRDYLSMPENTQVVFEDDTPVVLEDYEPVEPLPDSYVAVRSASH
jgi:hypothetical protein